LKLVLVWEAEAEAEEEKEEEEEGGRRLYTRPRSQERQRDPENTESIRALRVQMWSAECYGLWGAGHLGIGYRGFNLQGGYGQDPYI
jgi:hypothetical protein